MIIEKVIFLDRDGVINIEKNYLYKIEDFEFIDGVFEALKYLQNLNYKLIIITNQSGIGREYYSIKDYEILTNWIKKQFLENDINISAIFYCPHTPSENCNCRKPMLGMIEESQELFNIDFKNSWLIGDKDSDIETAINGNISNSIQVLSGHKFDKNKSKAKYILNSISEISTIIKN